MPTKQKQTVVNVDAGAAPVGPPLVEVKSVGVAVLFGLLFGGVGAQDAGAQDVYNSPRDYTVRLVGGALDSWLEMTCTPEHAGLVARENDKDDLFNRLMFSGRGMLASQAEAEVARRLGPKLFRVGGGAIVGVPNDSLLKLGFRDLSVPPEERADTAPIGPDGFPYSRFLMTLYLDALGENLSERNIIGFAVIRACYFQREPRVFIVDEYGEPRWWVDNYLKVRPWG